MSIIKITADKYLISNGLKLCKVDGDDLVFFDRKPTRRRKRGEQKGDADVRINVLDLVRAVVDAQ